MRNEFVETVRSSKIGKSTIKLPNQKEFNRYDWSKQFKSCHSRRTKADEQLYRAGLWFHEYSKTIWEEVDQNFRDIVAVGENTDLLRLQVGAVNHLVAQMTNNIYSEVDNLDQLQISNLSSAVESIVTATGYLVDRITQQPIQSFRQTASGSRFPHTPRQLYDYYRKLEKRADRGLPKRSTSHATTSPKYEERFLSYIFS